MIELIGQKNNIELIQKGSIDPEPYYNEGYQNGYNEGYGEGSENGYLEGKQDEYNTFWDTFQANGTRTSYDIAFARSGWTEENFKPKYDLIVTGASQMFQYSSLPTLAEILENLGIRLDTANCDSVLQMFQGASIKHIPTIDMRKATNVNYTFGSSCQAVTIDKVIVAETTPLSSSTFDCPKLENITFEGTIGVSVNFAKSSLLTPASVQSIIDALAELPANYYEVGIQVGPSDYEYPETEVLLENVHDVSLTDCFMTDGAPVYRVIYGDSYIETFAYAKEGKPAVNYTLTLPTTVFNNLTNTQRQAIADKGWTLVV